MQLAESIKWSLQIMFFEATRKLDGGPVKFRASEILVIEFYEDSTVFRFKGTAEVLRVAELKVAIDAAMAAANEQGWL